jgi:aspartyl protease family protein
LGRIFWIIAGAAALVLIALFAADDSGTVMGMDTHLFATLSITTLWGAFIASSLLTRGTNWGQAAVQLSIWALIFLTLMAAYAFRYELQDLGNRFTGGLIPGSPISASFGDGREEVTLIRSDNGHFEAVTTVNGKQIRFLVDTGASAVVMSHADAVIAGIYTADLSFTVPVLTANGVGNAAIGRIDSLALGGIERKDVPVMITEPGKLGQSLLGQQFLESLSGYTRRGDRLTLQD